MKRLFVFLTIIGLIAIACLKTAEFNNSTTEDAKKTPILASKGCFSPVMQGDSSPTNLTSLKIHSNCGTIYFNTDNFSRGGVTYPPYGIIAEGAIVNLYHQTPAYSETGGNMIKEDVTNGGDFGTVPFINESLLAFENLTPNVLYSGRTFAINKMGGAMDRGGSYWVGYGPIEAFYINRPYFYNEGGIQDLTGVSCTLHGWFDDPGCSDPIAVGTCWSIAQNPNITNPHTTITPQEGDDWEWTSYLTGLTPNTTYYYRGYVTNSQGTFYSIYQNSFTTVNCPKFGLTGGYVTVSPTSVNSGVSTNVNATINGVKTGMTVTRATPYKYHMSGTITTSNWNGTNPCWSGLTLTTVPSGYSGAYFTQQMTITKSGCPSDTQTAKVLVNP